MWTLKDQSPDITPPAYLKINKLLFSNPPIIHRGFSRRLRPSEIVEMCGGLQGAGAVHGAGVFSSH